MVRFIPDNPPETEYLELYTDNHEHVPLLDVLTVYFQHAYLETVRLPVDLTIV